MICAALCGPTPRAAIAMTACFAVALDEARGPERAFGHLSLLVVFFLRPDRLHDLVSPWVQGGDPRRSALGTLGLVGHSLDFRFHLPLGAVGTQQNDPIVQNPLLDRLDDARVGVFGCEEFLPPDERPPSPTGVRPR